MNSKELVQTNNYCLLVHKDNAVIDEILGYKLQLKCKFMCTSQANKSSYLDKFVIREIDGTNSFCGWQVVANGEGC